MHSPHHQSEPLLQQTPNLGCQNCLQKYQGPLKGSVEDDNHRPSTPIHGDLPQYDHNPLSSTPLHTLQHTPASERKGRRLSFSSTDTVHAVQQQQQTPHHCTVCSAQTIPGQSNPPAVNRPFTPELYAQSSSHRYTTNPVTRDQAASRPASPDSNAVVPSQYLSQVFKGINDLAKAQTALSIIVDKQATKINKIENCFKAQQAQLRHKASKQTYMYKCVKYTYTPLLVLFLIAIISIIVYIAVPHLD